VKGSTLSTLQQGAGNYRFNYGAGLIVNDSTQGGAVMQQQGVY
jgi:hypothetical protein